MGRHPSRLGPDGAGRRRWLLSVPLAIILVLVTWLLAFGLGRDPDAYRNPLVGRRAPAIALRSIDGSRTIRLSDFRGEVVVVNFWASWCADCVVEHDALSLAWDRYRDQGAVVLGVVYQDTAHNAAKFASELGGTWPQAVDDDSKTALAYGVRGVPETFVVSPTGRVVAWHAGAVSYGFLSRTISRQLQEAR
jgi:cytochrome c biogenesis protein CcmG/thiol:disulfide interchange protein DsbE